jgi:murein DD-endopeptidase MepM/ murein hydrolase activator NlpD
VVVGAWLISLSLVVLAVYLGWQVRGRAAGASTNVLNENPAPSQLASGSASDFTLTDVQTTLATDSPPAESVNLPAFNVTPPAAMPIEAISRKTNSHTIIPNRPRQEIFTYIVTTGDSVFGIANKYGIKPESVLWANYNQLNDNPDELSPGMELNIPPVDGVYYEWQEGDTITDVASRFKAEAEDILTWPGNELDLTNPTIEVGTFIMIPGGEREFRQWIIPTIARENSGVSKATLGPGACEGNYSGAYGSGAFAWPTANHFLSGNDYWSGHLGIDIAGGVGDGVFASDSGVVVFAGWALYGYGYMIMVDHGNGYQTLYAHLSQVSVGCGQSVYQGNYIGAVGSTGNSTGPHLHFEVRYLGGFVNPWYVLPAP